MLGPDSTANLELVGSEGVGAECWLREGSSHSSPPSASDSTRPFSGISGAVAREAACPAARGQPGVVSSLSQCRSCILSCTRRVQLLIAPPRVEKWWGLPLRNTEFTIAM